MVTEILQNKKHVFWQAFFLTVLFLSLGMVFGVYIEQLRADDSNALFYQSETSLYDSFALGKLLENPSISCNEIRSANVDFANRIYDEAKKLEDFDQSNKITNSIKTIHRKYDLLRTLLWMNIVDAKAKCGNINTVVYLYQYNADNIEIKSKQAVWSKILQDLKDENGDNVILIPIAADQNITTLSYLTKAYNVTQFPAVIINEKMTIYDLRTVIELDKFLN